MSTLLSNRPALTVPEWFRIDDALSRRRFLGAGAAGVAALGLAACGEVSSEADQAATWEFTDGRGIVVRLPKRPERIVAYIGTAAVLWDFGVRPVGVFGPQRRDDGTPEPAAGRVDLDSVTSVGETWDSVRLEALAELAPDLVVTGLSGEDSMWVITEEQLDQVTEIAPVLAIRAYDAPAREITDGYAALAEALGADVTSTELDRAKADWTAASERVRAAATAKPGLRVLVTYADADGLYVAKPADFPDLLEFRNLGVDLVEPGGTEDYWEQLSWEQAGTYPADLILHDERSFSLQPDQLAGYPTWAALPAVAAGQVGRWSAETVLSYQGMAETLAALAETLESARPDVV